MKNGATRGGSAGLILRVRVRTRTENVYRTPKAVWLWRDVASALPAMDHMETNQWIQFIDQDHANHHAYYITVTAAAHRCRRPQRRSSRTSERQVADPTTRRFAEGIAALQSGKKGNLREERIHSNQGVGQKTRSERIAAMKFANGLVGVVLRIGVNKQAVVSQVDNPVFLNLQDGVERLFDGSV